MAFIFIMQISIFTLCDYAKPYGMFEVCISGVKNQIMSKELPAKFSGLILTILFFEREDVGEHKFASHITDLDGKIIWKHDDKPLILPEFRDVPNNDEIKVHYRFESVNLNLPKYGGHILAFLDNGNVRASIPLVVLPIRGNPSSPPSR